jgi:hypothetical protein
LELAVLAVLSCSIFSSAYQCFAHGVGGGRVKSPATALQNPP